jgi:hypothetical protein
VAARPRCGGLNANMAAALFGTRTRKASWQVTLIYNTYHTAAPDKNILLAFIFRP